ncbi:MAG: peroxiredoxin [Thermodesulfovibrionia bacterium]|nr:peroxiredoxin [Thermodesulfovibrionia bacterium]
MRSDNLYEIPLDVPIPQDDGAARHLLDKAVPSVGLASTRGDSVRLSDPANGLVVVYCYPRTGRPDSEALGGTANWNAIPGARGCTPQSCAYRDLHAELRGLGAVIYGLSTQTTDYQLEAAQRLHLPFPLLSDANYELSDSLQLPQFEVAGNRLLKRITLIIRGGHIIHYLYPVYPPDEDAKNVIEWIRGQAR